MELKSAPNAHGAAAMRQWAATMAVLISLQNGDRAWLDNPGFLQSPVDLPLRLDDAGASPTTPQGPQQQVNGIRKGERASGSGEAQSDEATGADLVRQRSIPREHSPARQYVFSSCLSVCCRDLQKGKSMT